MVEKLIHEAAGKAPSKLVPVIKALAPVLSWIISLVRMAIPVYSALYTIGSKYFNRLPQHLIMACFGLALCLFGGTFPMTIAAYEAFTTCGWENTKRCIKELSASYQQIKEEDDKDNLVDADGDGIADVNEISGQELVQRKLLLWARVANPDHISEALGSLYTAWLAVIAVLKIQFAKTVALGNAIGNAIKKPVSMVAVKPLSQVLPDEYHNWINTIINIFCKSVAISVAWRRRR